MLKREKGITLIALIITIIVMLILVGVTINVALNGGLFTKAQQATRQTEEKAILEEMLAMMDITSAGKINSDEIINKMKIKYPTLKYDETTKIATITGKLGTYNYIVSGTEIKIGTGENELFDWESVGLRVDINAKYSASTGGILTFSEDGKIRVVDDNGIEILVIYATDSSKIKNGKIDYIGKIPGLDEDTNIKVRMNEQDENDENVYIDIEAMGETITCVKKYTPTLTGYEFTLNSLGDWETSADSMFFFEADNLWNLIGKDLSQDENYSYQGRFILSSTNSKFIDYWAYYLGIETIKEEHEYVLGAYISEPGKLAVIVKEIVEDNEIEDLWRGSSLEERQAFLEEFGDVVFEFRDISDLEIPE